MRRFQGSGFRVQGGSGRPGALLCNRRQPPAKRPAAAPHGSLTRRFAALRTNRRDGGAHGCGQEGWRGLRTAPHVGLRKVKLAREQVLHHGRGLLRVADGVSCEMPDRNAQNP